tara:strand:- start:2623 stop:4275 length:1653 start_codon:yes stop_codon:yes gene_type:complete
MNIKEFNFSLDYISNLGETRNFAINGDDGAIFSLVIQRTVGSTVTYYDFSSNTFGSTYKRLKNRKCVNGIFNGIVVFPAGGLSSGNNPNIYNIYLYAEHALGTTHVPYVEARFADDSLDINSSIGSNSSLLEKVLYQHPDVVISLSAGPTSPSIPTHLTGLSSVNSTFTLQRGKSTGVVPFSITTTLNSSKVGKILKQPSQNDVSGFVSFTPKHPLPIPGDTVLGEALALEISNLPRSNSNTFTVNEIGPAAVGMTVKGAAFDGIYDKDFPVTITAISSNTITINKSVSIANIVANVAVNLHNVTYRRFVIDSTTSIHTLVPGLICIGSSVADNTTISRFLDTTTHTIEKTASDGSVSEETFTVVNNDIPALDTLGQKPTITNGVVSKQLGAITFNQKQSVGTIGPTKAYSYGQGALATTTGIEAEFTNLTIELAEVSTTINDADADGSTALTTFDVASASGIMDDVSVMSGVNLNSGVTAPVVTNISSNTITLTPGGHNLQNGQVVKFKNAGRVFTISGDIEFKNVDPVFGSTSIVSLNFDLEKLIAAS